jgi:hypothetical protein
MSLARRHSPPQIVEELDCFQLLALPKLALVFIASTSFVGTRHDCGITLTAAHHRNDSLRRREDTLMWHK